MLSGFSAFLQLWATQPLLPLLRDLFHTSELAVSLTITVPTLGVALSAPLAGFLADRIGRRPVIVWSAFLLALSALATATSQTLGQLIFWRFWQGVFTPGVFAITVAYINDEWREAGPGRTVAAYVSGTVSGGFSSRVFSGIVAAHFPWPWVFVALGAVNLALAVAIWAWLPEESTHHQGTATQGWARAVAAHLRNRRLLAAFLVGFCVLFSLVAAFTYITFHLAEPPFLLKPAALGSIFFVYLAGVVVTPIAGRSVDRFGHRKALAAAIGASIIGVAMTLAGQLWVIAAGLAVCCTGVFTAQVSTSAFVGVAAQQNRALAIGLYTMFYYLGGSVGGVLPGYFYSWGGWPACAAFIAGAQAVTIATALAFWKPALSSRLDGGVRSISV